jgi:uncharacterized protein (DUF58 family)
MSGLLDPSVLQAISGLDLVARTVVDGFIAGLHRSADFGFSQEFAEYRTYAPGDDLRHVDWNVYARTGRTYIKRFHGETNSPLTLIVDASNSMGWSSHSLNKLSYARFAAASLAYLATRWQRDAAGLLVFNDAVRDFVPPASRSGQLVRLLASLEAATPQASTRFDLPLTHLSAFVRRRGIVVMLSDFYAPPADIIRAVEPLRIHGSEVVLFHVLDPQELKPLIPDAELVDMESGEKLVTSARYAAGRYSERIAGHVEELRKGARKAGVGHHLLSTDQPLDLALREYLHIRQGRD